MREAIFRDIVSLCEMAVIAARDRRAGLARAMCAE
jgi:hypothetical protein